MESETSWWGKFLYDLDQRLGGVEKGLLGPAHTSAKTAVSALSPFPLNLDQPLSTTEALLGIAGPIKGIPKIPWGWSKSGSLRDGGAFAQRDALLKDYSLADMLEYLQANPLKTWPERQNATRALTHVFVRDRDSDTYHKALEMLKKP